MDSDRRSLYRYQLGLLPVFGFFRAGWTLYRDRGKPNALSIARRATNRFSVTLGLLWLVRHFFAEFGTNHTESPHGSLLIFSSL